MNVFKPIFSNASAPRLTTHDPCSFKARLWVGHSTGLGHSGRYKYMWPIHVESVRQRVEVPHSHPTRPTRSSHNTRWDVDSPSSAWAYCMACRWVSGKCVIWPFYAVPCRCALSLHNDRIQNTDIMNRRGLRLLTVNITMERMVLKEQTRQERHPHSNSCFQMRITIILGHLQNTSVLWE